ADRRYSYPYINCADCGPRYSIILELPYDRSNTTMRHWSMCAHCKSQYREATDRRFHAQPVACPVCGPHYTLTMDGQEPQWDEMAICTAAQLLAAGKIVAVKGLGGYHLACDAKNAEAVRALRERKFRKEKPFALMAQSLEAARKIIELSAE